MKLPVRESRAKTHLLWQEVRLSAALRNISLHKQEDEQWASLSLGGGGCVAGWRSYRKLAKVKYWQWRQEQLRCPPRKVKKLTKSETEAHKAPWSRSADPPALPAPSAPPAPPTSSAPLHSLLLPLDVCPASSLSLRWLPENCLKVKTQRAGKRENEVGREGRVQTFPQSNGGNKQKRTEQVATVFPTAVSPLALCHATGRWLSSLRYKNWLLICCSWSVFHPLFPLFHSNRW